MSRILFMIGFTSALPLPATAVACRTQIRADVIVYGKLVPPARSCVGCGPRIKAYEVLRGPKQKYFPIGPPGDIQIACYRRTNVIGAKGTFGLVGSAPTYGQLYFDKGRNGLAVMLK